MNRFSKLIFLLLAVLIAGGFFGYLFFFGSSDQNVSPPEQIDEPKMQFSVFVDGASVFPDKTIFVSSTSLRPKIKLSFNKNVDPQTIEMTLDESRDVLGTDFYGEILERNENYILFEFSAALQPATHKLGVSYRTDDGVLKNLSFPIQLAFVDHFSRPLNESNSWYVAPGSPRGWFRVENEKLVSTSASGDNQSSLAFIHTSGKNFQIDYQLSPLGEIISSNFYIAGSKAFVVGSNGNTRMWLSRAKKDGVFGEPQQLNPSHNYHFRITREGEFYHWYLRELSPNQGIDPLYVFEESGLILEYRNTEGERAALEDHFGFGLWQNSEGVLIDDFYFTTKE